MAQKKDGKKKTSKEDSSDYKPIGLKRETRRMITGVLLFVLALFFVVAIFGGGGLAGKFLHTFAVKLLGLGYILLPIVLVALGIGLMRGESKSVSKLQIAGGILFVVSVLGMIDLASGASHASGFLGQVSAWPFLTLFDTYIGIIFLGALLLVSLFVLLDEKPDFESMWQSLKSIFSRKGGADDYDEEIPSDVPPIETADENNEEETESDATESETPADDAEFPVEPAKKIVPIRRGPYTPPPLSLLERDHGKPNTGDIKANSNIIKRTLENFGIQVEMDEITIGPTVTRYALKPAQGVKLSRIVGLQNDLALSLAAHPIRIEAPIPGKSLVGIEIPNKTKSTVGLGSLLSEPDFATSAEPLLIAIGKNVPGRSIFRNLARAPHMLIAGTTGSGKSVAIHAIITSLLYKNSPEDLKFIMVDPKRVELTLYNNIPHLLTPVITDAKKCILALKWAAKEMERRYDILQGSSVRDIQSYHKTVYGKGKQDAETDRMPYMVIIIDELADIMSTYPRELESAIVRLAQMSRAVGIHLILSTQRPEVNVITGLIKANVPTRVALRVPTQIDSRTILDAGGAEKLLGSGDMLYASGEGQPERLQSAFISEEEVKKVVKYLVDAFRDEVPSELNLTGALAPLNSIFSTTIGGDDGGDDDDLYEEARQIVIETGKASTSFLQRKLGVGYARAARLIDILEERGIVGPGNGAKPREVLEKSVETERAEYQ